ncbi:kinase [Hirsutella rhossiliensis]|uniref:non-specific serine/threonine protein kinase n=1 Tax=Hirsutella rhossiliensis TaxID=111463 RepID=A0A9P8MT48_9HYPO|nr:kinase [Hirsutella rhossiliensis]KAH0960684.1 kinase [Hirsutella rhossiliensis]
MNGDLSLSQALGGLRIANPDDAAEASHSPASPDSTPAFVPTAPSDRDAIPSSSVVDPEPSRFRSSIYDLALGGAGSASTGLARLSPECIQPDGQGLPQLAHDEFLPLGHGNSLPPRGSSRGARGESQACSSVPVRNQSTSLGGPVPLPTSSEEWKDRGAAVGVRREVDSSGRSIVRQVKKGVRDFSFGRILGEGSYSTVYLATDRQTLKEYAVKVLEKRHIIKEKKIKYVNIEKNTLNRLTEHPGIVRLYYTFQDETSLYYVLDLCNGGELLGVLKKTGTFDVECVRFYGAQILDSMEYMHSRGVIHRDIKPENVLLDDQMHVKITDFGTARLLRDPREPRGPDSTERGLSDSEKREEQDDSRAASFASDLWAFGCIIYQLLAGRPPFKAGSEYLTFQKIVNLDYEFPQGFPPSARDLVERCLVLDPARRLTIEHIKNHEFFQGQQFGKGLWRTKAPRLRSYNPPAPEPSIIQLNGLSGGGAAPPNGPASRPPHHLQASTSGGNGRPSRIITELPPPTQLDIEWSPVLTKNNERILKLGDLMVISTPLNNALRGPEEGHKKLSRFFGGSTTKKRQRLVMITSSGRIVLAPAGGEEKRAKQELSLLSPDCSWRSQRDARGQLVWCVDTGGQHYTFEELKASSSPEGMRSSVDDWIECLEKARDLAMSANATSQGNDDAFAEMPSTVSSPASTLGSRANHGEAYGLNDRPPRNHLSKTQGGLEDNGVRRNRFSKRQSRNGVGPAF